MPRFGLLNLNKPVGRSSRAAVDHVARLVRPDRAGHAGTLDPLASGVLVMCVGQATRLIGYVQQMPKRYTGTFLLGRHSPTEDVEGEVTVEPDAPRPTAAEISRAAAGLTGEILQRPPAYSAIKVAGRRSYDLARAGKPVELKPRPVTVHGIEIVAYEYPQLVLDIECGSGTYVRSLGRDLAAAVGTSAVMSALIRTAVGGFRLAEACDLGELTRENIDQKLLPALSAVESLPRVSLDEVQLKRIGHGLSIELPQQGASAELAAIASSGQLAAILQRRVDGSFGPRHNFAA
jgi:tRNA pseudouridine55 synthase